MEQPEGDPHAYIDGITGLKTIHPQVPVFYYTCDEDIAGLISIMNYCGIHTINSCQDNRHNRGTIRRVWVEIPGEHLLLFLSMLDRPDETSDIESLSRRITIGRYPDRDYQDNRAWHYEPLIQRVNGQLAPLTMSIRFPATDLPVVVERLREAAREMDGRVTPQPPDENPNQDESNSQP